MHETLPCKICGRDIDEGQLCDKCKGLAHRNALNGVKEESMCKCRECGYHFEAWKNGVHEIRNVCKLCVVIKRKKTLLENMERKKILSEIDAAPEVPKTQPEYGGPGDCLLQPMPLVLDEPKPTEPTDHVVRFSGEPDLAGKIAARATRHRRTFEQQVFYMLETAITSIEV